MNEKIMELKEKVLKFYEEHSTKVNYALTCVACIFLGYTKGKADSFNKLSDINFNIRIKDDAREGFSSKSH